MCGGNFESRRVGGKLAQPTWKQRHVRRRWVCSGRFQRRAAERRSLAC
jgi:hypothetical protein